MTINRPTDSPIAVIDSLLQRNEIIELVRQDPMDKRELVASLDHSRSTIDRGTRELELLGLLTYEDGAYRPTTVGEITADALSDFIDLIEIIDEFGEFFRWVPIEAFDLNPHLLVDADLRLPERGNPYAMVNRHVRVLKNATSIRCLLPLTGLHAHEACHNAVVHNGAKSEIVCTPSVAETLQSPDFVDLFDEMVDTGRYDLFIYHGTTPYFVGVIDETVQIGVDENGAPRAIVETDAGEVREWANAVIDNHKRQAEPLMT